jgi:Protein of unknown function (DUF2283).
MKIHLDEKADALYLRLDDSPITDSEETAPGIILDYNAHDQVVGIEILDVKRRVPVADLRRVEFEIA